MSKSNISYEIPLVRCLEFLASHLLGQRRLLKWYQLPNLPEAVKTWLSPTLGTLVQSVISNQLPQRCWCCSAPWNNPCGSLKKAGTQLLPRLTEPGVGGASGFLDVLASSRTLRFTGRGTRDWGPLEFTASLGFLSRGLPDGVSQNAGMPDSASLPHCDLILFNLSRNGRVAQASLELSM